LMLWCSEYSRYEKNRNMNYGKKKRDILVFLFFLSM
jgi:hypothetical protein